MKGRLIKEGRGRFISILKKVFFKGKNSIVKETEQEGSFHLFEAGEGGMVPQSLWNIMRFFLKPNMVLVSYIMQHSRLRIAQYYSLGNRSSS